MFFLSIGNDGERKRHIDPTIAQLWLLGHDGGSVRVVTSGK